MPRADDAGAERQLREAAGARLRIYLEQRWPRSKGGFRALCAKAEVGPETLYRWMRGDSEPDLGSIRRVAAASDVTRAELVAVMDGQAGPLDWRDELREAIAASAPGQPAALAERVLASLMVHEVRGGVTDEELADAQIRAAAFLAVALERRPRPGVAGGGGAEDA